MLRYDKQSTTQSVKIFFIKSGILWLLLASISPFYTNSAQNYYKKRTYASKMSFFSKKWQENGKVKSESGNRKADTAGHHSSNEVVSRGSVSKNYAHR
jgi:hypothetical protein